MNDRELSRKLDMLFDLTFLLLRLEEHMALNLDSLNAAAADLDSKADAVIAALKAGSAADQAQIDAVVPQLQAIAAKLAAATA